MVASINTQSQVLLLTMFSVRGQALLDAWFPLWPLVFQPAIGVLMLGAVRPFLCHFSCVHVASAACLRRFETRFYEYQHNLVPC